MLSRVCGRGCFIFFFVLLSLNRVTFAEDPPINNTCFPFLALPDDIRWLIIKNFLPQKDQTQLRRVCSQLKNEAAEAVREIDLSAPKLQRVFSPRELMEILPQIKNSFPNLRALSVHGHGVPIQANVARMIAELFPDLQYLNISYSGLGSEGAAWIAQLQGLQFLDVSYCSLGKDGAEQISHLRKLVELNIRANMITDAGLQFFGGLEKIRKLNISDNAITNEGAKVVAQLQTLESLSIHHNRIGVPGAKEISQLRNLKELDISYTALWGDWQQIFAENTGLVLLHFNDWLN